MRYGKGHKDASRQRIMEVAGERFRSDGIAATGLAAIMSDAGLTNGAFYPHFKSKADLVREAISTALDDQAQLTRETVAVGGVEAVIDAYLSSAHRDNPGGGCTFAALLPELARQPNEARSDYARGFLVAMRELAKALPTEVADPEQVATAIFATLVGTLQLARAAQGTETSDRILESGAKAARELALRGFGYRAADGSAH